MADAPTITVAANGPYLVNGAPLVAKRWVATDKGEPVAVTSGQPIEANERYALCRCGESSRKPFCDGTHARVGFDGTETAAARNATRVTPADGDGITIYDDRAVCVHAGFCGTAATNVWKMAGGTSATDVRSQAIAMIERCPSGALSYRLNGATQDNELDLASEVAIIPNGPIQVTGGIAVTRSDGSALETRNRVTLCRCGQSGNKPLCDGSHKEAGFTHDPLA